MSQIIRPMLAGKLEEHDLSDLRYPVIGSPKIDGIRCLKINGRALSRSFKPIKNNFVRQVLELVLPEGADGEIFVGPTFQDTTSAVMSIEGEPVFAYFMFDYVANSLKIEYCERLQQMAGLELGEPIQVVPTTWIDNLDQLLAYEREQLDQGFEGAIFRDPHGPYKCGRSTLKEGWLLKLKRFVDSEAKIIGFEEQLHNTNAAEVSELGLTKRSTHKAGKVPAGTLGKFVCIDLKSGEQFSCGTGKGLTAALRKKVWKNREAYLGKILKYKYQPIGVKDAPRIPLFCGFRDPSDM